ncbi:phage tail protein [Sphingomonas sp. 37zxx]|uniref:phage tail protein n=1 Tax=Sphingomonas sp. 37zxx TaxID=1550073 RepID=UPI00053C0074|nr:tail fiber protein [Sphingomonas sp. 37zxx]
MSDQFLGEIRLFAGVLPPVGWVFCDGALLAISEYDTLFALLGSVYGGDGSTTFAVPDLRGRVPICLGQGLGLSSYSIGQKLGTETVTLITATIPAHKHAVMASTAAASLPGPTNAVPAMPSGGTGKPSLYVSREGTSAVVPVLMDSSVISVAGGNQPHPSMMPYLAISYIMASQGIFPSQN